FHLLYAYFSSILFTDTATHRPSTLSLHDALPIWIAAQGRAQHHLIPLPARQCRTVPSPRTAARTLGGFSQEVTRWNICTPWSASATSTKRSISTVGHWGSSK